MSEAVFVNDTDAPDIDVSGIESVISDLTNAWNVHDADQFAAPFTSNATFVPWFGALMIGAQAVADTHRFAFTTVHARSIKSVVEIRIRQVGRHVASVRVESLVTDVTDENGALAADMRERWLIVMRVVGDEWKICDAQNTYAIEWAGSSPGASSGDS